MTSSTGAHSSMEMQMDSQDLLPVTHPESKQGVILHFKEVAAVPLMAVAVKKPTHTDPVMSGIMELISHESGG